MYYPLQIPSILDEKFISNVLYKEYSNQLLEKYIMCIWSMKARNYLKESINNVILPDGCIDLIVDFSTRQIYFSGNSKATLKFPLIGNVDFMGIRMKPGIFYDLFKLRCDVVMDNCILYNTIEKDYNLDLIFNYEKYEDRIAFLTKYINEKVINLEISSFTLKLNKMDELEEVRFVTDLAKQFGYSERQLNRIFKERCGVSVKVFLNIIRLHKCLKLIIDDNCSKMIDLAHQSGFYDESHFIRQIQKYCGISPTDLISRYKMS